MKKEQCRTESRQGEEEGYQSYSEGKQGKKEAQKVKSFVILDALVLTFRNELKDDKSKFMDSNLWIPDTMHTFK